MRIFLPLIALIFSMAWTQTAQARILSSDDFDPTDRTQIDAYRQAVTDLEKELTIVVTDENNDEIFRVIPLPLELITLRTQLAIHELDNPDSSAIQALIDQANEQKPYVNSFEIDIIGTPEWVGHDVSLYFYSEDDASDETQIPTLVGDDPVSIGNGKMIQRWIVAADTLGELESLRVAKNVVLVVGEDDITIAPEVLDIGYWRQYQLFDITDDTEAVG
jgi:hypothetical protein